MGDKKNSGDKKKKKKGKKADSAQPTVSAALLQEKATTVAKKVKTLAENPMVAEVVATALIATAAALKDTNKTRRLAEDAGDELTKLGKAGAEKGSALWQLALDVGRRALDALENEEPRKAKKPKKA
jgi:hypothetical protein